MNNLNHVTTLQRDSRGVYVMPNEAKLHSQHPEPTAMSAATKEGLIKAGLGLVAFWIAPQVCFFVAGVYGFVKIELKRRQYAPKEKSEAKHLLPRTNTTALRQQPRDYNLRRKTTEITVHSKIVEEYV